MEAIDKTEWKTLLQLTKKEIEKTPTGTPRFKYLQILGRKLWLRVNNQNPHAEE